MASRPTASLAVTAAAGEQRRGKHAAHRVMREVVAVGRAHGVDLAENDAEVRLGLADDVAHDMTSSMHYDLERGNPLEIHWLSGGVVELGMREGVPTPLNRAIADILALHAAAKGAQVQGDAQPGAAGVGAAGGAQTRCRERGRPVCVKAIAGRPLDMAVGPQHDHPRDSRRMMTSGDCRVE